MQTVSYAMRKHWSPALRYAIFASLIAHISLLAIGSRYWPQPSPLFQARAMAVNLLKEPRQSKPPPADEVVTHTTSAAENTIRAPKAPRDQMPLVGIFAADSSQPVEDQPNERFDIEAAKQTARGYARERPANATPERINLQSHNTEVAPGPLTRAITRATTANCREKYAGLGLLGIPLLLKDSVTDGCVW